MEKKLQNLIKEQMEDKQEKELVLFYKALIMSVTNKEVEVSEDEIPDEKYGVEIMVGEKIPR